MQNNDIPDENIRASSESNSGNYQARLGRLNDPSCWAALTGQTGTIWIQADIGYQTHVSGVITQGDGGIGSPDWVTTFKVSTFLTTGANEVFLEDQNGDAIVFPGNVDSTAKATTFFSEPVPARIVRINCLAKGGPYYVLRFEILGCKA
ncbi:lactadherin-like [Amphiura filiformis]|uniref:lactadherin-like n=1 Tax=Amphiura filiformis TaxID=82378 RepID=UPI003B21195D